MEVAHTASISGDGVDGMQLLQVHVVFRHGEKSFGEERNAMSFPSYPLQLPQADLTEQGAARMRHLGAQLREAFCESQSLLSSDKPGLTSFACCNTKRNGRHWKSLELVVDELWPGALLEELAVRGKGEAGVYNSEAPMNCPGWMSTIFPDWEIWRKQHAAEQDVALQQQPGVAALVQEASTLLAENMAWSPGTQNGPAHHLCIRLAYAMQHEGESLPPGVCAEDYAAVSRACHKEDFVFFEDAFAARNGVGWFLGETVDTIRHVLQQPPLRSAGCAWPGGESARAGEHVPKLLLYSSHDYAVGTLAAALGASFGEWPVVGSFIMLEVFQQEMTGDAFVRMTRNSQPVQCILGVETNDDFLAPWSAVIERMCERAFDADMQPLIRD